MNRILGCWLVGMLAACGQSAGSSNPSTQVANISYTTSLVSMETGSAWQTVAAGVYGEASWILITSSSGQFPGCQELRVGSGVTPQQLAARPVIEPKPVTESSPGVRVGTAVCRDPADDDEISFVAFNREQDLVVVSGVVAPDTDVRRVQGGQDSVEVLDYGIADGHLYIVAAVNVRVDLSSDDHEPIFMVKLQTSRGPTDCSFKIARFTCVP